MTTKALVKKSLISLGALGLVSLAAVEDVSARGMGAAIGRPNDGSYEYCFDIIGNGVQNTACSSASQQGWEVPLVMDNSGSKTITFSGENIDCRAFSASQTSTTATWGTPANIPNGSITTSQTTVNMPGAGRTWLFCTIKQNGKLVNVNYGA